MKLKEIVFIAVLFFIIKGFDDLLSMHNYDFNCLFDPKTYTDEPLSTENSVEVNDTVYIKGLGDFNESSLQESKRVIEEVFGVTCVIGSPIQTNDNLYLNGTSKLDANKVIQQFGTINKVVFVTNETLYNTNTKHTLKGYCLGKTVIVRDKTVRHTTIHEFGHTFGLDHCDNKDCVMGAHSSNNEFCNKCKNQINLK
jgi:predicted Zn-dependent protease